MELEGSLPHSQVPATCHYPEPAWFSPCVTFHFLYTHLNIILPSMSGTSRLPHQNPVYASTLSRTRYMPSPSNSSRFDHPNNIGWAIQIIQLLVMQLPPLSFYLVPLRPKFSPQHPILKHPQPTFSLNVSDQVSHPYKTTCKIIFLYTL